MRSWASFFVAVFLNRMNPTGQHGSATPQGTWLQRRSLKLRLAFWFSLIAFVLLLALLPLTYTLTERRLNADLDRQLEIDWILIEAHLESDGAGGVRWRSESPSTLESGGYAESWFDVWEDGRKLMSHWPAHGVQIKEAPKSPEKATAYHDLVFEGNRRARTLQKNARIGGREMTLRLFHDKSSTQGILREILVSLGLGVPIAVLLAAAGGYFMADRALRPITQMTEQARNITSESLGCRLPNPNPHDELGQLATVFNETLERLERSFDALRRFTADASHEFRTPLTALRSVGEIALREARDPELMRETIGSMLEEAQRLHDLADTLLNLARIESGHATLHPERVWIDEAAAEVCERLEVLASEKQQNVEVDIAPGLAVEVDPVLFRQAVMNLVHNAIRYSHAGSTVRITGHSEKATAIIDITDEGPGIAEEHRERVFDRFYRIDKARSRQEGGTGIGLALAKLTVELFKGTINLESELGRGSRFEIRLPLSGDLGEANEPGT
jgi:heavy metal sensor kinase